MYGEVVGYPSHLSELFFEVVLMDVALSLKNSDVVVDLSIISCMILVCQVFTQSGDDWLVGSDGILGYRSSFSSTKTMQLDGSVLPEGCYPL